MSTELNILLRGQSNSQFFQNYGGMAGVKAAVEAWLGFDGIHDKVNLIGNVDPDANGNATTFGGTSFLPNGVSESWLASSEPGSTGPFTAGRLERSMLAHIASLPADVRAAPTATLWMHDEGDAFWPGQTAESWEAGVRYDASLVRAALGQGASTTPYLFTSVIPFDPDYGRSMQAIKVGMEALTADRTFNAAIATHTGDLNMDNPINGFTDGRVFFGGPHVDQTDVDTLAERIFRTVTNTFSSYAKPGSALQAVGGRLDDAGPQVTSAVVTGHREVHLTLKLDLASTGIAALGAGASSGLGWTARTAAGLVLHGIGAAMASDGTLAVAFDGDVSTADTIFYAYGDGRIAAGADEHRATYPDGGNPGQGNSIYDSTGMPIWTAAVGIPVQPGPVTTLQGRLSEYRAVTNGTKIHLVDTVAGRDGEMTLSNGLVLHASDGNYLIDDTGSTSSLALLYRTGLGREIDEASLAILKADPGAYAHLSAAIPASAEYALRYGATSDLQFIRHAFQEGLGRAPSPDDEREYGKALASGASRADVLDIVAGSAEARICNMGTVGDPLVASVYQGYMALLGRTPEYAGLVAWTSARIQGLSADGLARGIAASAEFQAAHVGQADSAFVQSVYQGVLHRGAGADEEQAWVDKLSRGVSRATVGVTIGSSNESVLAAFSTTHEGIIKLA